MGKTYNSIIINGKIDDVFEITNDIARWKDLFSEYKESEVLSKADNVIRFRLETNPDQNGNTKSWVSERIINKEKFTCQAQRIDPLYPFEFMNIYWEYNTVDEGTEMIWIQEFQVAKGVAWNESKFENFINENSRIQMKIIKDKIENGFQ